MTFALPEYHPPDFSRSELKGAPAGRFEPAPAAGVAPDNFHATSIFPEYIKKTDGTWELLTESRMDCVVVARDGGLEVTEFRRLQKDDLVLVGRHEDGDDGIFVHTHGFTREELSGEKFAFRSSVSRETSFSIDYDFLYDLLDYERSSGRILWVMGPAVVFDHDSRDSFSALVRSGYVHGVLAGNALATHDLEGSIHKTALGQELYHKRTVELGHYKHLETINTIRRFGSIKKSVDAGKITDGIMKALIETNTPFVLGGSIRDDGPLPEVEADVYRAQDAMRGHTKKATTVIALATQLHSIATGNMTPSYQVDAAGNVRPVYFYTVDMSEFAAGKLADRGSLSARAILTNVQDFVVTLERGLHRKSVS